MPGGGRSRRKNVRSRYNFLAPQQDDVEAGHHEERVEADNHEEDDEELEVEPSTVLVGAGVPG